MSPQPGAMVRLGIKKLGRLRMTGPLRKGSKGIGSESARAAIDDHSPVGHIQRSPNETSSSAWRPMIATVHSDMTAMARIDPKELVEEAAPKVTTLTVDDGYRDWADASYPTAHDPVEPFLNR